MISGTISHSTIYIYKEKKDAAKRGNFLVILRYRLVFGIEKGKNETKRSRPGLKVSE